MSEDENYELFVKLLTSNEAMLRSFVRKLLPSENDVDDLMQEISITLWNKFDSFDPETNFLKWAYVVSRFKVMSFRRNKGREKLHFDDELLNIMAEEIEEESELSKARLKAMQGCIHKLPKAKRQMLVRAYQADMSMKELAAKLGKSSAAVYKTISRLRMVLFDCINEELTAAGGHYE